MWPNPELQRRKCTKIMINCLEVNISGFAPCKTFDVWDVLAIKWHYSHLLRRHFHLNMFDFTFTVVFYHQIASEFEITEIDFEKKLKLKYHFLSHSSVAFEVHNFTPRLIVLSNAFNLLLHPNLKCK